MRQLTLAEAMEWYESLPSQLKIATTSPYYVYVDAQRDSQLEAYFVGYSESDRIWLHGFHLSTEPKHHIIDCQAPYGYGCIATNTSDYSFQQRAWDAYQNYAKQQGWFAEFIRLHPMHAYPNLFRAIVLDDRQTIAINTEPGIDICSNYTTRCRTAIRKSIKHDVFARQASPSEISAHFPEFYRRGMAQIGADEFYLFNDQYFNALSSWDKVKLIVCEKNGQWISAGLFLCDGDTMEYHLSATTLEGRSLGATNLLLDTAAHVAQAEQRKWLYLGGGTNNNKDNPLLFFKQGFSNVEFTFRIGFCAFSSNYQKLKEDFENMGKPTNKFLFYRS